jgi:hypothetical protein
VRLLQKDAVSGDHGFVEREPRLGAVPVGEFADRRIVRPPRARGGQAVEDRGFRVFQIGQLEYALGVRLRLGFVMPIIVTGTWTDLRPSRVAARCGVFLGPNACRCCCRLFVDVGF